MTLKTFQIKSQSFAKTKFWQIHTLSFSESKRYSNTSVLARLQDLYHDRHCFEFLSVLPASFRFFCILLCIFWLPVTDRVILQVRRAQVTEQSLFCGLYFCTNANLCVQMFQNTGSEIDIPQDDIRRFLAFSKQNIHFRFTEKIQCHRGDFIARVYLAPFSRKHFTSTVKQRNPMACAFG